MKRYPYKKHLGASLFALSLLLAWGGMLYAWRSPVNAKLPGIIIAFSGYCISPVAVYICETASDQ